MRNNYYTSSSERRIRVVQSIENQILRLLKMLELDFPPGENMSFLQNELIEPVRTSTINCCNEFVKAISEGRL